LVGLKPAEAQTKGVVMKESLKKYMVRYGAIVTLAYGFVMVPLPMTTGDVTGLRWTYNLYDELKQEIRRNDIASRDRDIGILKEARSKGLTNDYKFQLLLLEMHVDRLGDGVGNEKAIDKAEKRIERLWDNIDADGIRHKDILSTNNMMYVVKL